MNESLKDELFAEEIVSAIQRVIGHNEAQLHEPEFNGNEWNYIKDCLDSNYVSSVGKFVEKFERGLQEYTGSGYAVAVMNGTSALHISLLLAGVVEGDEVLIPALTFTATANAVIYCGAEPHFVDSEADTLGIDPEKLRIYLKENTTLKDNQCVNLLTGKIIRAIVPVHIFGHPSKILDLLEVSAEFNIALVEDAAESLGSFYSDKHTGTFGVLGTLSFNGNKSITTGGGGAILTSDSVLAKRAKHLTTTAKIPHKWRYVHDEVGYNYRLPNLNAALGCAQLEQLESKINRKRKLFELYQETFKSVKGVSLMHEPKDSRSNYWLQTIILDEAQMNTQELILHRTNEIGIHTRPVWDLLTNLLPFLRYQRMDISQADNLSKRLINLPSSPQLVANQL